MERIYISADIEGIWGNVDGAYTMQGVQNTSSIGTDDREVNIAATTLFTHGAQSRSSSMTDMAIWTI